MPEPSRPRSKVAGGKLVANLRRSRSYVLQPVVTHLGTPMWEARQPVPSIPFFRACASSNSRRYVNRDDSPVRTLSDQVGERIAAAMAGGKPADVIPLKTTRA